MDKLQMLKQAFVAGLGIDDDFSDWDTLVYRGVQEWDSVAHMQMIAEIEDAFDIMIDTDDVVAMSSFNIAIEIVSKYGVEIG
jgi:acyl carrier protein